MSIKTEKAHLLRDLKYVEDISLLRAMRYMVRYALKNEGRISIEQYNRELEEAEKEVGKGNFITHEKLKTKFSDPPARACVHLH